MKIKFLFFALVVLVVIPACALNNVPFSAPTFDPASRATLEALGTEVARAAENIEITIEAPNIDINLDPPFAGIWNNQDEVLVLSEGYIYHRFVENGTPYEHFGEVQSWNTESTNPAKGEIVYLLRRIRIDGEDVGFDAPNNWALYEINGDSILYQVLVDPENPSAGFRSESTLTRSID